MDVPGRSPMKSIAGFGLLDVSGAGESVLLVVVVHLEREGVLDVVGLDRVPTVVAQLVRRREALSNEKSSIFNHVRGEKNLENLKIYFKILVFN